MSVEQHFKIYKNCVDLKEIQFTLEDFKRFERSANVKIVKEKSGIAILGLAKSEVEIYFIGVAAKFRGMGLGKKLVGKIIDFSRNYGANTIILEVAVENALAKNLYLDFNFKECGIRRNYYKNKSGIQQDAIIMKLNLKA